MYIAAAHLWIAVALEWSPFVRIRQDRFQSVAADRSVDRLVDVAGNQRLVMDPADMARR